MHRTTRPLATAAALFTILAGGVLAGGCHLVGPEERGWWFCDASGCYMCTPAGCDGLPEAAPQDPYCPYGEPCSGSCDEEGSPCTPDQNPSPTCSVSANCRAGYICTKGVCVPGKPGPCTSDAACGDGAFCNEGSCESTSRCTSDAQCEQRHGDGYGCDPRGSCALSPAEPPQVAPPCTTADACSGGFCASGVCGSCVAGDCGVAPTCLLDRHCGADRVCLDGHCTARCDAEGAACASGQVCKSGVCAPDSATCASDAECGGAGAVCVNNRCYGTCTATGMCDAPLDVCSGAIETDSFSVRICRPDDAAQLECKVSKDCTGGETCVNGVCRTACAEPEDCAACDDGPVCGPGGFCMTALEADPQCTTSAPCADGQSCLGGQCQAL